jgi:hypothetical protein
MLAGKRGEGMGFIGGSLFTIGAILATAGYYWELKQMLYAGVGLAILGAVAYKLVKV